MYHPGAEIAAGEARPRTGRAVTIAVIETVFWIALAVAAAAFVASSIVLVVRGIRLRRDMRALGGVLAEATVQLAVRTAAAEAALDRLEAQQERVRAAGDRLRRDLGPLAILRREIERFQTAVGAVRAAAPSK
ncbi:MAG TPA: hypothetical protein VLK36_14685 [Gaiellaceae bacterium]|nr:hypothetical protein [Gaiellaceae bacterium]